jgi:hypothetical protein
MEIACVSVHVTVRLRLDTQLDPNRVFDVVLGASPAAHAACCTAVLHVQERAQVPMNLTRRTRAFSGSLSSSERTSWQTSSARAHPPRARGGFVRVAAG